MRSLLCILGLLVGATSAGADLRYDALFSSHFEYYDDEDLFGGSYAPFYQSLQLKLDHKQKVGFYTHVYTTSDLSSSDDWYSDIYAMYLELRDLPGVSQARLGRLPHVTDKEFQVLDGGDFLILPHDDVEVRLWLGRSKVFYDSRFIGPPYSRANFTDTGLSFGTEVGLALGETTRLRLGYAGFDSQMDSGVQDWLSFGFSSRLPAELQLNLQGYKDLTEDSGAELHLMLRRDWPAGQRLFLSLDHVRPDRINPDVITSVFVADAVTMAGGGVTWPLSDHWSLAGQYEACSFEIPGEPEETRWSHLARVGLEGNWWLAHGLETTIFYRRLSGEVGDLHQIGTTGEKRITGYLSAGWYLNYVNYKREHEADRENASLLSGRAKLYLRPDIWFQWQLDSYQNIDFDYNVRTRLTLNFRLVDDVP